MDLTITCMCTTVFRVPAQVLAPFTSRLNELGFEHRWEEVNTNYSSVVSIDYDADDFESIMELNNLIAKYVLEMEDPA